MILKTKRLILRPWQESDAKDLYKYASNPDVGPVAGWPLHKNVNESSYIIRTMLCHAKNYAICLNLDNKAIGSVYLKLNDQTDMTNQDNECELGYWLGKPFWGHGLMPETAKEILHHAFENLAIKRFGVVIITETQNQSVFKKK